MVWLAPGYNAEKFVGPVESSDKNSTESKNTAELNNNPKLAQEEADRIIDWLPNTLDELSPQQQKEFIKYVEGDFNKLNLNFVPKDPESVPEIIPNAWQKQIETYKNIRKNISKLSPDKQEALKQAEKQAIQKMTEESGDIIDKDK